MAVNTNTLASYMKAGLSIIITGPAGTGKTSMLDAAAKELGWKMKYYNTPTIDPFADLIGIPIPNHGRKTIDYYRPLELDDADVVFFDELNRGDLMVLNSVFEIIQQKSLNGVKLDKLKCCVAAVNPVVEGYTTRKLDIALMDRFDLQLEADPNPNWPYFKSRYGEEYAKAGFFLYNEYQEQRNAGAPLTYLSPRRLDKLLAIFQKFPIAETVRGVMNDESGTLDVNRWTRVLKQSIGHAAAPIEGDLTSHVERARSYLTKNLGQSEYLRDEVYKIAHLAATNRHPRWPAMKRELLANLNHYVRGPEDLQFWATIIKGSSEEELQLLTQGWPAAKASLARSLS